MENNVYSAPKAELIDSSNAGDFGKHYVLPLSKLWIFSILSFGIFLIPWNYIHWRQIKLNEGSKIWPTPRALLSLFFVNSLFTKFELSKIKAGADHKWSPGSNASIYILCYLLLNFLDQIYAAVGLSLAGASYWLLFLSSSIIPVVNISNAQRVANISANSPNGESNRQWTAGNYIWSAICVIFWILLFSVFVYSEI